MTRLDVTGAELVDRAATELYELIDLELAGEELTVAVNNLSRQARWLWDICRDIEKGESPPPRPRAVLKLVLPPRANSHTDRRLLELLTVEPLPGDPDFEQWLDEFSELLEERRAALDAGGFRKLLKSLIAYEHLTPGSERQLGMLLRDDGRGPHGRP